MKLDKLHEEIRSFIDKISNVIDYRDRHIKGSYEYNRHDSTIFKLQRERENKKREVNKLIPNFYKITEDNDL